MTDNTQLPSRPVGLAALHRQLDEHFRALRTKRDLDGPALPIFALEHGRSAADLLLVQAEVCTAVRDGWLPREAGLPFVVYAAEIGYDYAGEEYWPTFESRTPGWARHGDRHYIRDQFKRFKETYRGAEPTGPWAEQFSIICWPITHAVLPTDLQRQLARLLSEYSRALTSELLDDPSELGRRLAARAWQSTSRFQNFAQNTDLLGQVAAALLVGDEDDSPFLLKSTLGRILSDLSEERQARRWLRNAKDTALHVRARGLALGGQRERVLPTGGRERLPSVTDPELALRRDMVGWSAYLELPDLSPLAERLPTVRDELARLRPVVNGVDDPRARGRLLFSGQRVRLEAWPSTDAPLIQLEEGSSEVNALLADLCRISEGPTWLFAMRDAATTTEVRGKRVHPGRSYILVVTDPILALQPSWIEEIPIATAATHGYTLEVPDVLDAAAIETLRELGVGVSTQVTVRPVGLVPALWDGDGLAEWNVGEDPLISVSSTQGVGRCLFTVDGNPFLIPWPSGESDVLIQVSDLMIGPHELQVALVSDNSDGSVIEGSLQLLIRPPGTQVSSGTTRAGLLMLATPIAPSLTELWDARAFIEMRGPVDAEVSVHLSLSDKGGRVLGEGRTTVRLPVDPQRWLRLLGQMREVATIRRAYDDAESCIVTVSNPRLGLVSLRSEREFLPLRWAFGSQSDEPYVRLIDNTVGTDTAVYLSSFASPDRREEIALDEGMRFRAATGGLVSAFAGTNRALVILPPRVHNLEDLRETGVTPRLIRGSKSVNGIRKLIELASAWEAASLPANVIGSIRRTEVLRAIAGHVASTVGGDRWERIEQEVLERREPTIRDYIHAIGEDGYQRKLALVLADRLDRLTTLQPESRTSTLAHDLAEHARPARVWHDEIRFAEFLLRLSSDTASLASWPSNEVEESVERALASPVLIRAARFLVLAIQDVDDDVAGTTYSGWVWP